MKKVVSFCFIVNILFAPVYRVGAQQKIFNRLDENRPVTSIAQDAQGYMWFAIAAQGLLRFDGSKVVSFTSNRQDSNTLASNYVNDIIIDSQGIIWIATEDAGLDRYDPVRNTFTHFRHKPKDETSLSTDEVNIENIMNCLFLQNSKQ